MPTRKRPHFSRAPWAYVLLCAPLVLLIVEFLRGAMHESQDIRTQTMQLELRELRFQVMLRAHGLGLLIETHMATQEAWTELRGAPWLASYWSENPTADGREQYAAAVDQAGEIVMHTDPARIGQRLARGWYE